MPCIKFRTDSTLVHFVGSLRAVARARVVITGIAMALFLAPTSFVLAQHTGTASGHEGIRKACSEEARAQNLTGNDFDDSVSGCVTRAPATQLQQHHQKLTACSRRATLGNLQGDARGRFVDECMRYHPSADEEKLRQCHQRASQAGLSGESKKKFEDECMKS